MLGSRFEVSLFDELHRLHHDVQHVFSGLGKGDPIHFFEHGAFASVDIATTPEQVEVRLSVPGMDPAAIDVSIQQNLLTVSGQREAPVHESGRWHRQERITGAFRRVMSLPEDVDPQQVEATYADGVLLIRVRRREAPKPRQIAVH
jgi:HSP20 family protein